MDRLPIEPALPSILAALQESGAVVVVAPPGSGKTTRVPPAVLDAGLCGEGSLIVLQPRRVAARACAARIAYERGSAVGGEVGFAVRMETRAGPRTRILVVTEGVLTRRLQDDPFLTGVGAVVLDEFHERSLQADLALALLAEVRREARPDLKIVVMSATLNPGPVSAFLEGAPVIETQGRTYPIEIEYDEPGDDRPLEGRVAGAVRSLLGASRSGDVLVFLPGIAEIERCAETLERQGETLGASVARLHGALPAEVQDRVLSGQKSRQVILSTNVAETSLTIPNVTSVVDSGLVRVLYHDPRVGFDRLELRSISRASADQRAGRAGRVGPGRARRLWTSQRHRELEEDTTPEIRRVDLAPAVLEILTFGSGPTTFRWFEPPHPADVERALELLRGLQAWDGERSVTRWGRRLAELPLHPRLGCLLLAAEESGVGEEGALLAALCSERDIVRFSPAGRGDAGPAFPTGPSDLLLRLDLLRGAGRGGRGLDIQLDQGAVRAVERVAQTLRRRRRSTGHRHKATEADGDDEVRLLKAVLAAFPDRVARRRAPGSLDAVMVGGRGLTLDPRSVVRDAEFFVAVDVDGGASRAHRGRARVRWASAIEPSWLAEMFPDAMKSDDEAVFDPQQERVVRRLRRRFQDLVLDERVGGRPDPEEAAVVLVAAARDARDQVWTRSPALETWRMRLAFLLGHCPELGLPVLDDDHVFSALMDLAPGCSSFAELRAAPLFATLKSRLSHAQRTAVDQEAPESLVLPSGRTVTLRYEEGRPPVLSATVQHLFGLLETPRLARGRAPVLVEVLAPSRRPVQLTQDLGSFWRNTYSQVRKDLRGRYPKHPWPERPPGFES